MFIVFTSLSAMIKDSIIVTCYLHDLLSMIQRSISVRVMTVAMPYITLYKPKKSGPFGAFFHVAGAHDVRFWVLALIGTKSSQHSGFRLALKRQR